MKIVRVSKEKMCQYVEKIVKKTSVENTDLQGLDKTQMSNELKRQFIETASVLNTCLGCAHKGRILPKHDGFTCDESIKNADSSLNRLSIRHYGENIA